MWQTMTDICGMRRGKFLIPYSDEDAQALYAYPEAQFLEINISGSEKEPSYRQLSLYWVSVDYIVNQNMSDELNHKRKVHWLTRIWCGFIEGTAKDPRTGLLHWMPKSISIKNCHQHDRQDFISNALIEHAELVGIFDVDEYKKCLDGGNEDGNP